MFSNLAKRNSLTVLRAVRPMKMVQSRYFVSASELSSLQIKNDLFIKRAILSKQVEILNNEEIPSSLKNSDDYIYRHIGNSQKSTQKMCDYIGVDSVEQLV